MPSRKVRAQDGGLLEVWSTVNGTEERAINLDSTYKHTDDYDRLDRMAISKSGDTAFIYFCKSKIAVVDFPNQTVKYITGFTDYGVGGMAFDSMSGKLFLCGWNGYIRSFQPISNKGTYAESAIKISGSSLTHLSISDSNNLLLISDNLSIYIVNILNGNSSFIYEADNYGDIWEICSSSDLNKILIRETTDEGKRILKLLTIID